MWFFLHWFLRWILFRLLGSSHLGNIRQKLLPLAFFAFLSSCFHFTLNRYTHFSSYPSRIPTFWTCKAHTEAAACVRTWHSPESHTPTCGWGQYYTREEDGTFSSRNLLYEWIQSTQPLCSLATSCSRAHQRSHQLYSSRLVFCVYVHSTIPFTPIIICLPLIWLLILSSVLSHIQIQLM